MASLYAAGAKWLGLREADYLYTFAAPAVSTSPLHTDFDCFQGARFYILDDVMNYDLVPNAVNWLGYVHPRIPTFRLSTAPQFDEEAYLKIETPCLESSKLPGVRMSTAFTTLMQGHTNKPLPYHQMTNYMHRLQKAMYN